MNLTLLKQIFIIGEITTIPYVTAKNKNQVFYGTYERKKYPQANKIVFCFVTGICTKELPRISQATQLKAGRIVPYFKVMRAWCDRFLVIGLWLRHCVSV